MKKKRKSWSKSFIEPFNLFYLGFLASVGLAFGCVMLINVSRVLIETFFNVELLVYSRIVFAVFYLFFVFYTYWFLDMKKNGPLRNGFLLFVIIFILGIIYIWI